MDADVAIVGFGPTGAVLAGLLAKRGVKVVVIERSPEVYPQPRAAHIDHTGLRTIQELGCLDQVLPAMIRNQSLDLVNASHELLVRVPAGQDSVSSLPTSVYFYQPDFDRVLRATVGGMTGVSVRLGCEMTGFDQTEAGVQLHVRENGKASTISARWVVGCDGAWSPVREALGIKLENLDFDERWLVLDLALLAAPSDLPQDRVVQVCDPKRPHLTTPISKNRQRFEFMFLPGETAEQMSAPSSIERFLQPWLEPGSYTVERSAIYTFHGLLAQSWRSGRVLIAGDAAHQMPPFLGQGMCSGLRDASNLAWKLALVVRSDVDAAILDSYEAERGPHVRKVIEAAIGFGQLVCMTDPVEAAQRDRRFLSGGLGDDERASFALPRLERGDLVLKGGGGLFVQPDLNGERLDDVAGPRFLIVARNEAALGKTAPWWIDRFDALVVVLSRQPNTELEAWLNRFKVDVAVIRPDRYVLGTGLTLDEITARAGALEPLSSAMHLVAQ